MWSKYFLQLSEEDKKDYKNKLTLANGTLLQDPFEVASWTDIENSLSYPKVNYGDIYSYLVDTPSIFTRDSMKAYKSLEAYNYFTSGHVQEVLYYKSKEPSLSFIKSEVCFLSFLTLFSV